MSDEQVKVYECQHGVYSHVLQGSGTVLANMIIKVIKGESMLWSTMCDHQIFLEDRIMDAILCMGNRSTGVLRCIVLCRSRAGFPGVH